MPATLLPPYLVSLCDALIDARTRGTRIDGARVPVPRTDADAYAVQQAVADALGWFAAPGPRAWKAGAAARDAVPNAAPLPPQRVVASPARFAAGTFGRMLIEGEVALRLRAPITDAASVTEAVGEWLVTIEIVDPRFADLDATSPLQKLADHGLHGALVVGSGAPLPPAVDWGALVARVRRDGEAILETRGGHPLGDFLFLLPWLARHAASRGAPLAAGDVVTAGTWTGVVEAFPGQTIDVEFPAIGRASVRFDAAD